MPQDLGAAIRAAVDETSYEAVWQTNDGSPTLAGYPGAFMAPNREQNYRTFFTPEGITIVPRVTGIKEWNLGIHFSRFGYEGDIKSVKAVEPSIDGDRIEYQRSDNLVEWYVNRPEGLEQGFTVLYSPKKHHSDSMLEFEMDVIGDLRAEMDGGRILFCDDDGVVLNYGKLVVTDATGERLMASMGVRDGGILIRVDDASAVYPIVVDPVIESEVKLVHLIV